MTALMTRAGNVTVTPVTLRSSPVSIPSRHHSSSSSLLEDDIGAGDYITLTSTNPALVFASHQDRGGSSFSDQQSIPLISLIPCRGPTGLDNSGHRPRPGGGPTSGESEHCQHPSHSVLPAPGEGQLSATDSSHRNGSTLTLCPAVLQFSSQPFIFQTKNKIIFRELKPLLQ